MADICDFKYLDEGLMNESYIFTVNNVDYIYRKAGEGTKELVNRDNEKHSLELAKKYDLDPTYIIMDAKEGYKISYYKPDYRKPDYYSEKDTDLIISLLKKLHSVKENVEYFFKPFEDAKDLNNKIKNKSEDNYKVNAELGSRIEKLYLFIDSKSTECFCHCDFYKPNVLIKNDNIILIDWEYSAMSNAAVDVGYYIVDAMYDFDTAKQFILKYLGKTHMNGCSVKECIKSDNQVKDFFIYIPIVAYYWTVWAVYKKLDGFDVDEYVNKWKDVAVKYTEFLENVLIYGII